MAITVAELTAKVVADTGAATQSIRDFGGAMTGAGAALSAGITVPIAAAGNAIIDTGLDFDTTMRQIVGLTDVTADEIDGITESVMGLAGETGRAPQELAEAFYFVASAGFEADEAMAVLDTSARASAAGLGETQDIAKVLGSVINAYGKENITSAAAADILTEAVSQGTAEASEFAGVVGTVVPSAAGLGVAFDDVAAALAGMTLTGLSAEESAVSLNQVFMSLLSPTKEAETALEDMGLSASGLRDQLASEGLLATLRTLEERFGGNEEAAAKVFGNVRALRGVTSLLTLDADQLNEVFGKVEDSTGRLGTAFEETEGPQREVDRHMAEMQTVLLELGKTVLPMFIEALSTLGQWLQKAITWWNSLDQGTREMIVTIAAVAAAIGPVLLVLGGLVLAIGALLSPIGLVVLAIAGFAAAWATNFMGIRDIVQGVIDWLVGAFEWLMALPGQVAEWFNGVMTTITGFVDSVIAAIGGFVGTVQGMVDSVIEFFANMFTTIVKAFQEFVSKPGYYIGLAIGSVIGWFVKGITAAVDFGVRFVGKVIEFISQLPGKVGTWLGTMWTQITTWFGKAVTSAGTAASNLVTKVIGFFTALPGKALDVINDLLPKLLTFFSQLPGKIAATVGNVGESIVRGIWNGVSGMFGWLWNQITGFVDGIIDGVTSALGIHSPSTVFADIGKDMALGLGQGFDASLNRVASQMQSAVGAIAPGMMPAAPTAATVGGGGTTVVLYADRYMGSAQEARYYSDMIARQIKFGG